MRPSLKHLACAIALIASGIPGCQKFATDAKAGELKPNRSMSPSDDNQDQDSYLEKRYPLIEQDAEPPGRSVDGIWEGQMDWRTRHGQAVVLWSFGRPHAVRNALYPDGTRGDVDHVFDHGFRRPGSGQRLWIYGHVEVLPDDVMFVDGEQPLYEPPAQTDEPNLEADLANDPLFMEALQNHWFARAFYKVFRNRAFYKGTDERAWTCGDRRAARLVAGLRNRGESYQDFYLDYDFPGTWPDDFGSRERTLLEEIEGLAKPAEPVEYPTPPFTSIENGKSIKVETEDQFRAFLERRKRRSEAGPSEWDLMRQKFLQQTKDQLQRLRRNENADVFARLHGHLTRLGWRTETEADREKARRKALAQRVDLLRELKRLEARPKGPRGEWAERIAHPGSKFTNWTIRRADQPETLTPEEQEARTPEHLRDRLRDLALNGKVSQEEYDALSRRIWLARWDW